MGSQCEASTKKAGNLDFVPDGLGAHQGIHSYNRKGTKGTTATKRFLVKIVPVLIHNGN